MTFSLYPTPRGPMAVVRTPEGRVSRTLLPGRSPAGLRRKILGANPDAREVAADPRLARTLERYWKGAPVDLTRLPVDWSVLRPFARRVYRATQEIPRGERRTYGWVARRIGAAGAARAVGRALGANPFPLVVPCHRVVGANGRLCGFSAPDGLALKRFLLDLEARATSSG